MAKLNKRLIYKFGAPIGAAAAIIAPIATMVSCSTTGSDNAGDSWQFGSHRFVQEIIAGFNDFEGSSQGPQVFSSPAEYRFDVASAKARNSEMIFLFRPVKDTYDKPQYQMVNGEKVLEKVVPGRTTKFRFDYIKGLTIIYDNNTSKTFDSDALSLSEAGNQQNWENSINGLDSNGDSYLVKALHSSKIKTIQLNFRDNLSQKHWIQQTTGKAGYELKPEDIFYGFSLNMAFESDLTSYNMSGMLFSDYSNMLGKFIKIAPNSNYKIPTTDAVPSKLWTAKINWGLDTTPYLNHDSTQVVKSVNGQSVYNLDFTSTATSDGITDFLITNLMSAPFAGAISAGEIEDAKKKYQPEIDKIAGQGYKNSLLEKVGYLPWLMAKRDEHYIAGKYYIAKSDLKELVMEQNPEYIDERWLNMKNSKGELVTIKTYKYKFIDKDSQAQVNIMNAYRMGTGISSTFTSLSINNQVNAISDPEQWGLNYTVGYTSNKTVGGNATVMQLMPLSRNDQDFETYFNDGYSKVMWGKTISELKAQGGNSWVQSAFSGTGFVFRNNLNALLNEFTITQNWSAGRYQDFSGYFAPEGEIGKHGANIILAQELWTKRQANPSYQGSNEEEKEVLQFLDQLYQLSSKWAVSIDGSGKPDFTEIKRDEFIKAYSDAVLNHYGPTQAFKDIITRNIKSALDAANIGANEKVTWELPVGKGSTSATINPEYKGMIELINSLDPRLNCVMELQGVKESQPNPNPTVNVHVPDRSYTNSGTAISQNPIWINRMFANAIGYNAGSLFINNQYKDLTPASPIMDYLSDLKLGTLQGLSYYADAGNSFIQGQVLSPLQSIIDSLTSSLQTIKTTFWGATDFKSSFGPTMKNTLATLDFKNVWKSDIKDLATYGELGFKGLENIKDKKKILMAQSTLTDDDKLVLKDIEYFEQTVKTWYATARADLKAKFATMDAGKIANVMNAFGIIAPKSFNPYDSSIGDRTRAAVILSKNWFTNTGMDSYSVQTLGRLYVDLDKDADGNAILNNAF